MGATPRIPNEPEFSIAEFVDELESDYQQRVIEKQVTLQVSRPHGNLTMRAVNAK